MKKPVDDFYHPPAPNFYANRGEVLATRANLPHWNKALTCCFVTFRLADSLPREELLKRLERRGVDLGCEAIRRSLPRGAVRGSALQSACKARSAAKPNYVSGASKRAASIMEEECKFLLQAIRRSLPREEEHEAIGRSLPRDAERGSALPSASYGNGKRGSALPSASHSAVEDAIQDYLDAGYGSCVLRDDTCRQIVEDALWHFASERYHLYAYVVMPNHVHVLFQPMEGRTLSEIVASWKKFTARQINDVLGREGSLWQKESFDTLVRSERHFQDIVRYIKKNDLTGAWVAYR